MKQVKYKNLRTGEIFILSSAKLHKKTIGTDEFLLVAKEGTNRFNWMKLSSLQKHD